MDGGTVIRKRAEKQTIYDADGGASFYEAVSFYKQNYKEKHKTELSDWDIALRLGLTALPFPNKVRPAYRMAMWFLLGYEFPPKKLDNKKLQFTKEELAVLLPLAINNTQLFDKIVTCIKDDYK